LELFFLTSQVVGASCLLYTLNNSESEKQQTQYPLNNTKGENAGKRIR